MTTDTFPSMTTPLDDRPETFMGTAQLRAVPDVPEQHPDGSITLYTADGGKFTYRLRHHDLSQATHTIQYGGAPFVTFPDPEHPGYIVALPMASITYATWAFEVYR